MQKNFLFLTFLLTTSLMIFSCGEVDITNLDPAQFPEQVSDPISFSNDLVPQFQSTGCTGCHGSGSPSGNLNLTSHSQVTGPIDGQPMSSRVDLNIPSNSHLLTYPNTSNHTGPALPPSSSLYQDILSWIENGALNN